MKTLIYTLVFISLLFTNIYADEDPKFDAKAEQVLVDPLGKKLVLAIKNNDKKLFLDCWISTDKLMAYISTLPDSVPVPKGDQLIEFRKYFDDAREVAGKRLDIIQKDLIAKGIDKSKINFVSIDVKYDVKHGIRGITSNRITFSFQEDNYMLRVDDALKLDGTWKFSDKPNAFVTKIEKQ